MNPCEKCHWAEWNRMLRMNPTLDQTPVDTSGMEHNHSAHVSVGKAAKELNVSPQMLIGLIRSGNIKGFAREGKTGQPAYRITREDLEQLKSRIKEIQR